MQKPLENIKPTMENSSGVFRLVKKSFDNSVKVAALTCVFHKSVVTFIGCNANPAFYHKLLNSANVPEFNLDFTAWLKSQAEGVMISPSAVQSHLEGFFSYFPPLAHLIIQAPSILSSPTQVHPAPRSSPRQFHPSCLTSFLTNLVTIPNTCFLSH